MNYLIDVNKCTVSYPSKDKPGETNTVLNDITFRAQQGEFITVVGPSGCGKSTFLRLILGSQFPNQGTVKVDAQVVRRVTRDCGIVYQNYGLFKNLTVLQNVMAGPVLEHTGVLERIASKPLVNILQFAPALLEFNRFARVSREARQQARELLAQCGLDPNVDGDKYPYELSGGMCQRVAIAQAAIMRPKILLMDEPFGALDESTREEMQDFIHEQWLRQKLTVFFVTHQLEEACKLGTRLVCLSQYWNAQDGTKGAGAKIMIDKKVVGGLQKPSQFKDAGEFKSLVQDISHRALERSNRQLISAFELTHQDAVKPEVK